MLDDRRRFVSRNIFTERYMDSGLDYDDCERQEGRVKVGGIRNARI